jgi:hypothetical protein|tara:strand:+ start:68 stop:331 length:264 start_codon:yes stop_codon:yes gene_type:complete
VTNGGSQINWGDWGRDYWGDVTNDADWPEIRLAFIDHAVIIIRAQNISADVHIYFSSRWEQINENRFFTPHPDAPNIAVVLKKADHT